MDWARSIIQNVAFKRLKSIAFLGAIDYVFHPNQVPANRRHNRYQHSLGVGRLAMAYCRTRGLSDYDTRHIVAAALLHDIGHGPLSHSLECVFAQNFQINHHEVGQRIILGQCASGVALAQSLRSASIDAERVVSIISGQEQCGGMDLFGGPINIDTIEAISRAKTYMNKDSINAPPGLVLEAWMNGGKASIRRLDAFWRLKEEVYINLVHSRLGSFVDSRCQQYMIDHIDAFDEHDFLLSEVTFRRRHPPLFSMLRGLRRALYDVGYTALFSRSTAREEVLERHFQIVQEVPLNMATDTTRRYTQSKSTKYRRRLGEQIPAPVLPPSLPDFFAVG